MKTISKFLAALALLAAGLPAFAWDGALSGTISAIEVTDPSNYGFRITFSGSPTMCTSGSTFAYLSPSDGNYATYVGVLTLAKALGTTVTVFTTNVGGYCHIGDVSST